MKKFWVALIVAMVSQSVWSYTAVEKMMIESFAVKYERDAVTILKCSPSSSMELAEKIGNVVVLMHVATELRDLLGKQHTVDWVPDPWPDDDSRGNCASLPSFRRPESFKRMYWTPEGFVAQ